MGTSLRDILLEHIDSVLDANDLENIGDYVRSILVAESIQDWQVQDTMKILHADLLREMSEERDQIRRLRLKAAVSYFEADFTEFLILAEVQSLPDKR